MQNIHHTENLFKSHQKSLAPSVLIRHRWLGVLEGRYWICHAKATSCRESSWDFLCYGCGSRLAFDDLPHPERYRAKSNSWLLMDSLATRLDLLVEEVKLKLKTLNGPRRVLAESR